MPHWIAHTYTVYEHRVVEQCTTIPCVVEQFTDAKLGWLVSFSLSFLPVTLLLQLLWWLLDTTFVHDGWTFCIKLDGWFRLSQCRLDKCVCVCGGGIVCAWFEVLLRMGHECRPLWNTFCEMQFILWGSACQHCTSSSLMELFCILPLPLYYCFYCCCFCIFIVCFSFSYNLKQPNVFLYMKHTTGVQAIFAPVISFLTWECMHVCVRRWGGGGNETL